MYSLVQVILVALFFVGDGHCQLPKLEEELENEWTDTSDLIDRIQNDLTDRLVALSFRMYEVLDAMPEAVDPVSGGLVASPLSVLTPLGLLGTFSRGLAKEQLESFLNLNPIQFLEVSPNRVQNADYKKTGKSTYMSLSKIISQTGLNFSKEFIAIAKQNGEETGHLNFRFPEAAAKSINDWASHKTKGAVKDVTDPRWITNGTELLMVNVLVFKGTWKYQFKEDTTLKMFSGDMPENFKVLKYMSQLDEMEYVRSAELNADIVRLPFSDENFDFILINPVDFQFNYVLNVTRTLRQNPELLKEALAKCSPHMIELALPKVTISSVVNMKEALKALGVTNIFYKRLASLQQMYQDGHEGFVSSMMQKVEIVLDNKGVMAANGHILDADELFMDIEDMKAIQVYATRPFVFLIRYQGYPLFLGSYEGVTRV